MGDGYSTGHTVRATATATASANGERQRRFPGVIRGGKEGKERGERGDVVMLMLGGFLGLTLRTGAAFEIPSSIALHMTKDVL